MIRTQLEPADDDLVNKDPFWFLVAMLLDQQISIRWAFSGPQRIVSKVYKSSSAGTEHNGGAALVLSLPREEFVELVQTKPTVHRFPKVMANRIYDLASHIRKPISYKSNPIWSTEHSAEQVLENLMNLPGFGEEKSKITLAALCKRFNHKFDNWESVCAPFSDSKPRTVADCGSIDDHKRMVAWKKSQKQKKLGKQD